MHLHPIRKKKRIIASLGALVAVFACSSPATVVLPELAPVARQAVCPPQTDAATLATGKRVYMRLCASCHQTDGRGLPGIFPPLEDHAPRLAQTEAGRRYLERLVLWGLSGPITIDGTIYQNVMPPQAGLLDDAEIAGVLTFVMQAFDNCHGFVQAPHFAAEDIAHLRLSKDTGLGTFMLRKTTDFSAPL